MMAMRRIRQTLVAGCRLVKDTIRLFKEGVRDLVRIENAQLVEHWGGPDLFSVLQQLGAVMSVK